jgi:predicted nucleic acid-binding protein
LKVVSNTTPILSLIKIGKLEILKDLFGSVNVPLAVYKEIEAGKDKEFYVDLQQFKWINIVKIKASDARSYLFDLDDGEAETIILAKEISADFVIIDEKLGRQYARHFNLALTGTIGILLNAKAQGIITEIAPLLQQLQEKQSWMSNALIKKTLQIAQER